MEIQILSLTEAVCNLGETCGVQSCDQVLHSSLCSLSVLPGHQQQFGLHVDVFAVRFDFSQLCCLHLKMRSEVLPLSAQFGCYVIHLLVRHKFALNARTLKKME